MSTPEPRPPAPAPPSAAARYAVVFAIGLMVGVFALVVVLRALESRRGWQDHYPAALMRLYQAHLAGLEADVEAGRCAPADGLANLRTLRLLSDDLAPAFPDLRDHRGFAAHADRTRRTLDAALASPPGDCAALRATVDAIGETCGDCHRDLR
ncbi:hypothetical protein [Luteimonas sp. FCS-9]|uniref:hypothetical protein n=1 Tax=Luteimonas sp. FCS-9 TaxID=1547516 RepID=UPI00063EA4B4|nr:hypothetical protein [Luteimonas sp. FCS-9]KLJ02046.1 hypothetical protein WQ56_04170 [Luteimonas sp. FCS-9]